MPTPRVIGGQTGTHTKWSLRSNPHKPRGGTRETHAAQQGKPSTSAATGTLWPGATGAGLGADSGRH